LNCRLNREPSRERKHQNIRRRQWGPQNHRAVTSRRPRRLPRVGAASPARRLFLRQEHAAFRRSIGRSSHCEGVGRSDFVEMMETRLKDRAARERPKDLWQEQVGHRTQLISGRGMAGNINTGSAQLLNESPDFRAAGRNLFSDLGAADHNRRILHQQTYDQPQPEICRLLLRRRTRPWGGSRHRFVLTSWTRLADAEIICEPPANDKSYRDLQPGRAGYTKYFLCDDLPW